MRGDPTTWPSTERFFPALTALFFEFALELVVDDDDDDPPAAFCARVFRSLAPAGAGGTRATVFDLAIDADVFRSR